MNKENILKSIRFNFSQRLDIGTFALNSAKMEIIDVSSIFEENVYLDFCMDILGQDNIQKYKVSIQVPKNLWAYIRKSLNLSYKTIPINRYITFNHMALMPQINYKPEENKIVMYSELNLPKEKDTTVNKHIE
jgi:hypothetical protein